MATGFRVRLLDKCTNCKHEAVHHQDPDTGDFGKCRRSGCDCQALGLRNDPRSKFHNKRVMAEGFTFDSQAECTRYRVLKDRADAGEISDLKVHPVFVLFPALDRSRPAITYAPDFTYSWNGVAGGQSSRQVAEDVKGAATTLWLLKRRCFEFMYPSIELRVVAAGAVGMWHSLP